MSSLYHCDLDLEIVLFDRVQESLRKCLEVLEEGERRTIPGRGSEGPTTWEDTLREVAEAASDRSDVARERLRAWESARNAAWTYLVSAGLPEGLARVFRANYPKFKWIPIQDVEAEVIFLLPYFVERFRPSLDKPANFATFCGRQMQRRLHEWAANQGAVQVPRDVARRYRPDVAQEGLPVDEEEM